MRITYEEEAGERDGERPIRKGREREREQEREREGEREGAGMREALALSVDGREGLAAVSEEFSQKNPRPKKI